MQEYGFSQTVNSPTRRNNILDVFITNRPSLITHCSTIPGISDYKAVNIKSSVQVTVHHSNRKIHIWKKADIPKMKQAVQNFCTSFLAGNSVSTLVDFLWKEFKKACHKFMEFVPTKIFSVSHNKYPWIFHHI